MDDIHKEDWVCNLRRWTASLSFHDNSIGASPLVYVRFWAVLHEAFTRMITMNNARLDDQLKGFSDFLRDVLLLPCSILPTVHWAYLQAFWQADRIGQFNILPAVWTATGNMDLGMKLLHVLAMHYVTSSFRRDTFVDWSNPYIYDGLLIQDFRKPIFLHLRRPGSLRHPSIIAVGVFVDDLPERPTYHCREDVSRAYNWGRPSPLTFVGENHIRLDYFIYIVVHFWRLLTFLSIYLFWLWMGLFLVLEYNWLWPLLINCGGCCHHFVGGLLGFVGKSVSHLKSSPTKSKTLIALGAVT